MARGDSLARQLQLWMLLDRERSLSVEDVCGRLSINRRTFYRDLEVLQRCGMPLWQDQVGRSVRWRLDDGFKRSVSVQLSVQEVMALVAAERLLASMDGTVFASAAHTAVQKLKDQLAEPIRKRLEKLGGSLSTTSGPARNLTPQREHLDAVLDAIERQVVVHITYQKLEARKPVHYTLEPHHVHVHVSSVYLVAWARERDAARIFLLDRIREVKVSTESFERRAELPVGAFDQGAFGLWEGKPVPVKLRFMGTAAQIVSEQRFHPSQRLTREEDGSVLLEMEVPLSPSLLAWLRGYGERAEVLGPDSLVSSVTLQAVPV